MAAGRRSILAFLIAAFVLGGEQGARGQSPSVITNCLAVLSLSRAEASESRPVRLQGVVTCYVPESQLLFIQDSTAGLYVLATPWPKDVSSGEVVEIEGATAPGRFSPIVQVTALRRTSLTREVSPARISLEELNTGRFDAQWVQIEGVVRMVSGSGHPITVDIGTGGNSARILLYGTAAATNLQVDARIRVAGVAGTFYEGEKLKSFGLFTPGPGQLTVLAPAPALPQLPLRTAARLIWFSPGGATDHRVRISGTVVGAWPGAACFIRDSTGVVLVETDDSVSAGDKVEAAGFIQKKADSLALTRASLRILGREPVQFPPALALGTDPPVQPGAGEPLAIEGKVFSIRSIKDGLAVVGLGSDRSLVLAYLRAAPSRRLISATVQARGVWGAAPMESDRLLGPGLWVVDPTNLVVLAGAPAPGASGEVFWLASTVAGAFLVVLLAGGLAWRASKLSRQAAGQNQALRGRLAAMEEEMKRMGVSRETLSRKLHDHIIQSIYAVGLSVEDCSEDLEKNPPKARARLKSALLEINLLIRELRNVILGLESQAIQPREFRTALKSLTVTLGDKGSQTRLDIDESAMLELTSAQATELIHIAREALSNSIRHGQAQTTTFTLDTTPSGMRFRIEDDGRGFDPARDRGRGFGLRNMTSRAETLGGTLKVETNEGHGTKIVLDFPAKSQHLSNHESRSRVDRG